MERYYIGNYYRVAPVKVSDKALHLVEYAIMGGFLPGVHLEREGLDFHRDCLHFVPALELGMNAFRIEWVMPGIPMCAMRQRMQWVRLLVFCSRWFFGRDKGIMLAR